MKILKNNQWNLFTKQHATTPSSWSVTKWNVFLLWAHPSIQHFLLFEKSETESHKLTDKQTWLTQFLDSLMEAPSSTESTKVSEALWRMCVWQTFFRGRLRVGLTEFNPGFSAYDPHNSGEESPQGKRCGGTQLGERWTTNEHSRRGSEPGSCGLRGARAASHSPLRPFTVNPVALISSANDHLLVEEK